MVTFLPEAAPKRQSFAQAFAGGLTEGLPGAIEKYQQNQKQNELAKRFPGLADLPPELQKVALSEQLKAQSKEGLLKQKHEMFSSLFGGKNQSGKDFSSQVNGDRQPNLDEMKPFDPADIPDEAIIELATIDPQMAMAAQRAKTEANKQKRHQEDISFQKEKLERQETGKITEPLFKELSLLRKNIPLQEQAISDIIEASPEVGALDYFADVTGFEPLRSASGAKFKTGIKDFFLSDLTRVGARPNQWVEMQLADALPKIGRSKEANLITAEGLKFKVDLAKKRLETLDVLAEKDREKYGFVKADVDAKADKEMKKYIIDRQKQLQDNIKKIKGQNKGKKDVFKMTSPDGSVYEVSSEDIDEALEHDFKLVE